jgi:hypothetical protein
MSYGGYGGSRRRGKSWNSDKLDLSHADFQKYIEYAEDHGFKVYKSRADRLMLDIDRPSLKRVKLRLKELNRILTAATSPQAAALMEKLSARPDDPDSDEIEPFEFARIYKKWHSQSGTNWHVIIKLDRCFSLPERLVMQMFLTSDPYRDMYSLARYWGGEVEPSWLARPSSRLKRVNATRRKKEQGLDWDTPLDEIV